MPATVTVLRPRTIPKLSQRRLLQASGSFQYRFEELGLEIEDGFSAGMFNGVADVTYYNDEDGALHWYVGDITLDCTKWNAETKSWDARQIALDYQSGNQTFTDKLYIKLWDDLTDGSRRQCIQDAVEARL